MHIKELKVLERDPMERSSKPRLYVTLDEHVGMPDCVLLEAIKRNGLPLLNVEDGVRFEKATWSRNAGCGCGCSPGFILEGTHGRFDAWVTFAGSLGLTQEQIDAALMREQKATMRADARKHEQERLRLAREELERQERRARYRRYGERAYDSGRPLEESAYIGSAGEDREAFAAGWQCAFERAQFRVNSLRAALSCSDDPRVALSALSKRMREEGL